MPAGCDLDPFTSIGLRIVCFPPKVSRLHGWIGMHRQNDNLLKKSSPLFPRPKPSTSRPSPKAFSVYRSTRSPAQQLQYFRVKATLLMRSYEKPVFSRRRRFIRRKCNYLRVHHHLSHCLNLKTPQNRQPPPFRPKQVANSESCRFRH